VVIELDGVVDVVRRRGARAQVCVMRHGEVVFEHRHRCGPDALFYLFSTSKPYVALLVHLLAQRGRIGLDDPLAEHWPEFDRHGKGVITIRQVLQHRAGVPVARSLAHDALAMTNWDRSVRQLERAVPRYPAGAVPAYHILSFGFLLGELVRRVTGAGPSEVLRTEFLEPLGLADTYLGLPDEQWARRVPVTGSPVSAMLFNRRPVRQAVVPAAGVSSTARDVAGFYAALLGGRTQIRPETLVEARRPTSDDETDRFLKVPMRWSQGFQLGGEEGGNNRFSTMGRASGRTTFGHNGSNACLAWADPERDLVVAYLTDVPSRTSLHQTDLSDAVLAAFP
jgi:CubicO group peptidase (beta-lactamase class C family)